MLEGIGVSGGRKRENRVLGGKNSVYGGEVPGGFEPPSPVLQTDP